MSDETTPAHREVAHQQHGEIVRKDSMGTVLMSDADREEYLAKLQRSYVAPGVSFFGVHLVLAVGTWLLFASYTLYDAGETGHYNALWSAALVTLVLFPALWLRQIGPSAVAVGIGVAVGVAYILLGALLPHDSTVTRANEIVSGVLIVIGYVLSLDTRNGGDSTSAHSQG
ncbi:hypothetical protein [Nocardioides bruguierae]|uniref:Uncharacterized protein n=1 Tax=Nocardioides bruguierae TaxID=2945102 RepID=A0A9X2D8A2_9ACTN|nr:hypothetical protein [Nocardioides bruguierae]MCL8025374.1 hypothetical protein [Nocardioides bruguierae]MCM0621191.1 hypothetical protein [Nocardioides bruguierae]